MDEEKHPSASSRDSPSETLRLRELFLEASEWDGWAFVPDGALAAESLKIWDGSASETDAVERLRTIIEVVDLTAERAASTENPDRDDHLEFLRQLRERLTRELDAVGQTS